VVTRRSVLIPLAVAMAVLAGCNSGSTFNVQNQPPPPLSDVNIAFQPVPSGSIGVGFSMSITAVVSNDSKNYGVDWSLSCQTGGASCGTLSSQHTNCQGTTCGSTIYLAPSPITGSSESVTVVAYATADHTKNVTATFTVNSFDNGLKAGNYVLQAQGNQNGVPYQFAGVITVDGEGNVTGGEQTVNSSAGFVSETDGINPSGSSYFLGNDGRGTITLNDPSVGTEIFSFVLLGNSQNPQALICQTGIDGTGATASGTMELQTSTSAPQGSYAFATSGTATQSQLGLTLPVALGGIFSIDSNNNILGLGDEIFGREMTINGASLCSTSPCTISAPDTFGQVVLNLTPGFGYHNHQLNFQLTGYIVDAAHIQLMESDYNDTNSSPFGLTGGLAIAQSAGSANNFAAGSLSGTYVFGVSGVDLSQGNAAPSTLTSAGVFTADGNLNLGNGFTDTFLLFDAAQGTADNPQAGAEVSATFDGIYAVDATGRATLSFNDFIVPATNRPLKPPYAPQYIFYLTDSQEPAPALVLEGEYQSPPDLYPSLGTGIAYPQSTTVPVFSGNYGFSITQVSQNGENDATAQMNANPANTPALSGLADSALSPPIDPDLEDHMFTGSFANPQSNGIFSGTFNAADGLPFAVGDNASNNFSIDYYFIDQEHGFFVETDLVSAKPTTTSPTPSGQVSFGYYSARTQLCSDCP
jgi:hypothetical protein